MFVDWLIVVVSATSDEPVGWVVAWVVVSECLFGWLRVVACDDWHDWLPPLQLPRHYDKLPRHYYDTHAYNHYERLPYNLRQQVVLVFALFVSDLRPPHSRCVNRVKGVCVLVLADLTPADRRPRRYFPHSCRPTFFPHSCSPTSSSYMFASAGISRK